MIVNRRMWIGLAAAGAAAAPALAAAARPGRILAPQATPAFAAAVDRIVGFGAAEIAAYGIPGMTLAIRAADGQTARATIGFASLERRADVSPDQLFQIGSISKSLVALALFRLAGEGRLDLDTPALAVVPELPLPASPVITIAQLLAHSAGLPDNTPPFANVPGGRLWAATPPGTRFSYSNAGYDMLAHVVQRLTGQRFDDALASLVLRPLGMATAEPVIRSRDRDRYAQGYVPFGARPWFPRGPIAEGPWLDIDRSAGSVAMTPADMLKYVEFIGRLVRGDGAPLFGPALAQRFVTPQVDAPDLGPGARYGNGLMHMTVGTAPVLFHTGGMLLFSSAVCVDPATGAGVFASTNIGGTGYRPRETAKHGVALLRALATNAALPADPAIVAMPKVDKPGDFAGRFLGPDGAIEVVADGDGLRLGSGRLRALGDGSFVVEDVARAEHVLDYVAAPGARRQLWWGGTLYARDAAPAQPAVPPRLAALTGVYLSNDPWIGGAEVVARGNALAVEGAGEIREAGDGSWRFAAPEQVTDRLWFEAVANGRPQRFSWSGQPMDRFAG